MKNKIASILLIAAALCPVASFASSAAMEAVAPSTVLSLDTPTGVQFRQSPTSPGGISITNAVPYFWDTAVQWFTSLNTNSTTWTTDRGSIWAGADYVSGLNTAATLGGSFNLFGNVEARGEILNAGIAGTIDSLHGGFGYHISTADVRVTPFLLGGYDFVQRKPYVSPGIELRKAMTARTFAYLGLDVPIFFNHNAGSDLIPRVSTGVGFTF